VNVVFIYLLIFNITLSSTYTSIGINTFHIHDIKNKANLNNNNNLINYEINDKNIFINYIYFKNSLKKDCYGVGGRHKK